MPTVLAPKPCYRGRGANWVPRTISLDRRTDEMLRQLSHGNMSSFLRQLIAAEFARQGMDDDKQYSGKSLKREATYVEK